MAKSAANPMKVNGEYFAMSYRSEYDSAQAGSVATPGFSEGGEDSPRVDRRKRNSQWSENFVSAAKRSSSAGAE